MEWILFSKFQKDEIEHIQTASNDKEKFLKDNIKQIAELDEAIILIDDGLKELQLTRAQMLKPSSETNVGALLNSTTFGIEKETPAIVPASPKKACQKPQVHSALCAMRILRQNIAAQKAQIMKNLELNNCNKHELDEDIAKLQHMQKQYILYEKDMAYIDEMPNRADFCLSSDEGDVSSEDFLRGTHADAHSNFGENRDEREKVSESPINVMVHSHSASCRSNSIVSRNQSDINCKSALATRMKFYSKYIYIYFFSGDSEYVISVPSYVIRGAGKQTHFEYEVRITLSDEKWTLLRRFSRFRELHLTMKSVYGDKVAAIPFPRRELFSSNSESVARNRRRQLETYLRRLLVVCSKIPQCPFYEGPNGYGLCKSTLVEFSQFFRKGIFENGKYGTGWLWTIHMEINTRAYE